MTARTMTQIRTAIDQHVRATITGPRCIGCGCEYDNRTSGCKNCAARYWRRIKRRWRTDERRRLYALGQAPEGYRPREWMDKHWRAA